MNEIIFVVEEAVEGRFTARALGESIFTEGDDLDEVRRNVREAVDCHFEEGRKPQIIRLHFVRWAGTASTFKSTAMPTWC